MQPCSRQRGGAVLLVVLVLAGIAALAAAYGQRALLADTRASGNELRAAQAFEAAEAGLEWAVAMLGQGRVDAACRPTDDAARPSLRQRALALDAAGVITPTGRGAACVWTAGGWHCACADDALAALASADAPGFALRFATAAAGPRPGTVKLESRGCRIASAACLQGQGPGEGTAVVQALLGQVGAIAAPPAAALTVRGRLDLGAGAVRIAADDIDGPGLAVVAGGTVVDGALATILGRAGSPRATAQVEGDATLSALDAEGLFVGLFGVDRATHRMQPALLTVDCRSACADALEHAVRLNPGRALRVAGDMHIDRAVTLGSAEHPLVLQVEGGVEATAGLSLHGLLHLRGARLAAAAGTHIRGAVVAEGDLALEGAPHITYDAQALRRLQRMHGSLVRAPGGWRDLALVD